MVDPGSEAPSAERPRAAVEARPAVHVAVVAASVVLGLLLRFVAELMRRELRPLAEGLPHGRPWVGDVPFFGAVGVVSWQPAMAASRFERSEAPPRAALAHRRRLARPLARPTHGSLGLPRLQLQLDERRDDRPVELSPAGARLT